MDGDCQLLVMELELAAARTDSVSSVPAFLKEVLRKKLEVKTAKPKMKGKEISKSLEVGKHAPPIETETEWEEEPLTEVEKEKTLNIMRERIEEGHRELVMTMKQSYTSEDWMWLMENPKSND